MTVPAIPPWAHSVSRLHGLGLLSVAAYEHSRVGVTPAFVRRVRRVRDRARRYGLLGVAHIADLLAGGAARFGCRGATDNWIANVQAWLPGRVRDVLALANAMQWTGGRGTEPFRRARHLCALLTSALADLVAGRTGR